MKSDKYYVVTLISDYEDEHRTFVFKNYENAKKKFLSFSDYCVEDMQKEDLLDRGCYEAFDDYGYFRVFLTEAYFED